MRKLINNQRGDTIIEVMFATVIISIVLAGAFGIASSALRYNQTATERTEVSNKIREQIEMLTYLRENRNELADAWNQVLAFEENGGAPDPRPFYFNIFADPANPSGGLVDPATLGAGFVSEYTNTNPDPYAPTDDTYAASIDIFNIRVIPRLAPGGDYIDFTVRASWQGIGDVGNQDTGAVIRLPS